MQYLLRCNEFSIVKSNVFPYSFAKLVNFDICYELTMKSIADIAINIIISLFKSNKTSF